MRSTSSQGADGKDSNALFMEIVEKNCKALDSGDNEVMYIDKNGVTKSFRIDEKLRAYMDEMTALRNKKGNIIVKDVVQQKIETYLEKHPSPSSDLGKARRTHMVQIYNKVGQQMQQYAYYTGITSHPIRRCDIVNNKIAFENVYKDRAEFELQGLGHGKHQGNTAYIVIKKNRIRP